MTHRSREVHTVCLTSSATSTICCVAVALTILLGGCASPPPQSLVEQADAAFAQGNPREADRLYRAALKTDGDDPWALYGAAKTALRLHDAERSLGLYVSLAKVDRDFFHAAARQEYAKTLREVGLLRLDTGRTAGSVEAFRALARLDPSQKGLDELLGRALTAHAQSLAMHGRREEAMACYEEAIGLMPRSPAPYVGAAEILISTGRKKEALALLQGARRFNPGDTRVRALTVEAMGLY